MKRRSSGVRFRFRRRVGQPHITSDARPHERLHLVLDELVHHSNLAKHCEEPSDVNVGRAAVGDLGARIEGRPKSTLALCGVDLKKCVHWGGEGQD